VRHVHFTWEFHLRFRGLFQLAYPPGAPARFMLRFRPSLAIYRHQRLHIQHNKSIHSNYTPPLPQLLLNIHVHHSPAPVHTETRKLHLSTYSCTKAYTESASIYRIINTCTALTPQWRTSAASEGTCSVASQGRYIWKRAGFTVVDSGVEGSVVAKF